MIVELPGVFEEPGGESPVNVGGFFLFYTFGGYLCGRRSILKALEAAFCCGPQFLPQVWLPPTYIQRHFFAIIKFFDKSHLQNNGRFTKW